MNHGARALQLLASGAPIRSADQDKFLDGMCDLIKRERMPLPSYLLIHRERETVARPT